MKKARWSDEFKMLVIVVLAILWIIGMYFFAEYLYQVCPTDPERWICRIM